MRKVLILGVDGYIGWPLRVYMKLKGWDVYGVDNFRRREVPSLVPLSRPDYEERPFLDDPHNLWKLDIRYYDGLKTVLKRLSPDVIIHLAEEPSAPYSMKSILHMQDTIFNNIGGTTTLLHVLGHLDQHPRIIKLGSMGEYIPSSWYHVSKQMDSCALEYASRLYNLEIVDVMQGPVYGVGGRFDYNEQYGTVINRFIAQALVGGPITVYGSGEQVRGFLPIQDSLQCLELLASVDQFASPYTKINQFAECMSINEVAGILSSMLNAEVVHLPNPRMEGDSYPPDQTNDALLDLGYLPCGHFGSNVVRILEQVRPYKEFIDSTYFMPHILWRNKS